MDLVVYDVGNNKEMERIRLKNPFKVENACILQDFANYYEAATAEEMKAKMIVGVFKPDSENSWEFKRPSDWEVVLFRIKK